jgi:ATP-dependent Clp protease ATP-binding subunit ClpB
LDASHIADIAELQLAAVRARLAERSLALSVNAEVMSRLAEEGFDPVYGARPLKRAIQRLIENPLAEAILAGAFAPGDTIEVALKGGEFAFSKANAVSEAA